jgi:uncharacterized protein
MERAAATMLPDGKRLHLHHGPIDIVLEASGKPNEVTRAYKAAAQRFETILEELTSELPLLRTEIPAQGLGLKGDIARTMEFAVWPYWEYRVTPMAAVAGSVADHVLHAMTSAADLTRAYVNNGGDIALHLADDEIYTAAAPFGQIYVAAEDKVRGIATSGWRGRSFSLGIADAVTVLAQTAAEADVAATLIANAVDLPLSARIDRKPAFELYPDSDLRDRLVTVGVGELTDEEVLEALGNGVTAVQSLLKLHHVDAVTLMLRDEIISLKCVEQPQIEETDPPCQPKLIEDYGEIR